MCESREDGKINVKVMRRKDCGDIELPHYMSRGASGMDLYAAVEEDLQLEPGAVRLIPAGIHISLPDGYEAQVRPRSGLALKNGVTVLNSPGTVDSDYRNEVGVILANFGADVFTVSRGMRIAQMVIARTVRAELIEVDALDETERGLGGFGSTGS